MRPHVGHVLVYAPLIGALLAAGGTSGDQTQAAPETQTAVAVAAEETVEPPSTPVAEEQSTDLGDKPEEQLDDLEAWQTNELNGMRRSRRWTDEQYAHRTLTARKIVTYARRANLPTARTFRIARCESAFDPTAKAKTSSAYGVFQFIDGTWRTAAVEAGFDPQSFRKNEDAQIVSGILYMKNHGVGAWRADPRSPACWDR